MATGGVFLAIVVVVVFVVVVVVIVVVVVDSYIGSQPKVYVYPMVANHVKQWKINLKL